MLQTKDAHKLKVYVVNKKGRTKKYGRVRNVIFHPSKPQAVGITVKRPDLLWMIKRKDRIAALDKISRTESGDILIDLTDNEAWDNGAAKRLGFSLDECIIWDGMSVRNLDGVDLGAISNITLGDDLKIESVDVSSGGVNRALLGSADITAEKLRGYDMNAQAIVADIDPEDVVVNGGVAAKAGEAWAKGSHKMSENQEAISDRAAENIEQTAYAAGEAIANIKEKVKDSKASEKASEMGAKAGEAINSGAYKLGRAIGNLKSSRESSSGEPAEYQAPEEYQAANPTAEGEKPKVAAVKEAEETKKAAEEESDFDAAAKAVGAHLKKASGMFSAFKEEFDKASK